MAKDVNLASAAFGEDPDSPWCSAEHVRALHGVGSPRKHRRVRLLVEVGSSKGTRMDYSQSPNSTATNAHDYQQLVSQHGHTDSNNSYTGLAKLSARTAFHGW